MFPDTTLDTVRDYLRTDFKHDDVQLSQLKLLATIVGVMEDRRCSSVYIRDTALSTLSGVPVDQIKPILINLADQGIVKIQRTGKGFVFSEAAQ